VTYAIAPPPAAGRRGRIARSPAAADALEATTPATARARRALTGGRVLTPLEVRCPASGRISDIRPAAGHRTFATLQHQTRQASASFLLSVPAMTLCKLHLVHADDAIARDLGRAPGVAVAA
jgi:hypothetical protein